MQMKMRTRDGQLLFGRASVPCCCAAVANAPTAATAAAAIAFRNSTNRRVWIARWLKVFH